MNIDDIALNYRDKMYSLAYKLSCHNEDAEDIVQEALIIINDSLNSFRGESNIYTWIYRIVLNVGLKHKKRLQNVITDSFNEEIYTKDFNNDDFLPDLSSQERSIILDEFLYEIREKCHFFLMFRLTEEQRIVFILSESMQLSMKDTASILNTTISTVKSRLFRARKKLKDHITKKCYWYNPDNPCRCDSKAGYVLKKYPQVISQLRKREMNPKLYQHVKESLKRHNYNFEDIYQM